MSAFVSDNLRHPTPDRRPSSTTSSQRLVQFTLNPQREMSGWLWGASPFDEMVEKATSELMLAESEDIALNLEICDQIRSKAVLPKAAMQSLKKRLNHQNPNVQLLTLSLLDVCVKNGGDHFIIEIASKEFMDNLVSLLKVPTANREVKERMLKIIQTWAVSFQGKSTSGLSYVDEAYKTLKREGFNFPPKEEVIANSAMVDTSTAPEWIDSDVCLRCRTAFSFTNRRHHCRNCGRVYDQQCSSKTLPLPHFGITEPVRVCDSCYITIKKKSERADDQKLHRTLSHSLPRPPKPKSRRELADEELQKAIALSLQEHQADHRSGYVSSGPSGWPGVSEPPVVDRSARPQQLADEEDDPELRAAIEASLREAQAPKASAPDTGTEEAEFTESPTSELQPKEADAIMTFSQTIQDASARGTRDLVRYPGVGELLQRADELSPKLTIDLQDASGKEQTLADMHEKLSEVVKLYDRLLTEQISRPARRYAQYTSPYPAGPAVSQTPTGYQQHDQYVSSAWGGPSRQWSMPPQSNPSATQTIQAPYEPHQHGYAQPRLASPPTVPQMQPLYTGQANGYQYVAASLPPPTSTAMSSPSISTISTPAPVQNYPEPVHPHYQQVAGGYHSNPAERGPPTMVSPVPPPPQFQQTQPYSEPQRYQSPVVPVVAPPTPLPSFPSAPTTAPQQYTYAPALQQQPKEAMLISFD